jgi:hypothetical protein
LELCEQNYEHLEAERDKLKIEWADDANQYEERIAKLVERVSELELALEKIKFRNHPGTTNHELAKEALSRTSEENMTPPLPVFKGRTY